jgi:hypothetical protein
MGLMSSTPFTHTHMHTKRELGRFPAALPWMQRQPGKLTGVVFIHELALEGASCITLISTLTHVTSIFPLLLAFLEPLGHFVLTFLLVHPLGY